MIVLLYHAAFAADYSFSPKFSLRNFSRKKAAFLPPQNLGTPARPFSAALGRPKKFTISSLHNCGNFGHEKTPEKTGVEFRDYLLENWGALLAALRPYFFLSFILGSLVR